MKRQTVRNVIGPTAMAFSFFLVAAVTNDAHAAKNVRYECTTAGSEHVLTLPVAPLDAPVAEVKIVLHGVTLTATYVRDGLNQLWYLEKNLYVELTPNLIAHYWDFRGAEKGEERTSEATFWCKKKGK